MTYGEEMLMFGGGNQEGMLNDLYILDMKYVGSKLLVLVLLEKDKSKRNNSNRTTEYGVCNGPKPALNYFWRIHSGK